MERVEPVVTDPGTRRRLAILVADAVGYQRLMGLDSSVAVAQMDAARATFTGEVGARGGRLVDMAADSVLAVFDDANSAVNAALAIQQQLALKTESALVDRHLSFRVGVHLGDVIERSDGTVHGEGIEVAARLQGLTEPGGVNVSSAVFRIIAARLEAAFDDLGAQSAEPGSRSVHAFRIRARPQAARATSPRFRFGRIELRPAQRLLLVDGEPATVGARAFDLLVALTDHRDRVLTYEELRKLVWRGVVVEDNNIQVQVSNLRKVVGADAIATVPGHGYRFVLPLEELTDPTRDDTGPAPVQWRGAKTNLPNHTSSFVGREPEIFEVKSLLARTRLLTLTGVGGCGKTRLAQQVAADLLGRFEDGVWLVELAPVATQESVPHVVTALLRCPEVAGADPTRVLLQHIGAGRMLLIFDNAEHVVIACSRLVDQLLAGCPNLSVLVTSREGLRIAGELTYRVPNLSTPDPARDTNAERLMAHPAAQLYVQRARLHRPNLEVTSDNAPWIASICRRLDGIPLAIELAAARARSMSAQEIDRHLEHGISLLVGGSRAAVERQWTMRATLDWSFDLLSGQEQDLLCRLTVFRGGLTLSAAESVCCGHGIEDWAVLDLLTSLVDKSLVQVDERQGDTTRYRLLEPVRQYAQPGTDRDGDSAPWADRHLDHFLALAEEAEPRLAGAEQGDWLARLHADRDNMTAALTWAAAEEVRSEKGLRLASALGNYWSTRGFCDEGLRWLDRFLLAVPADRILETRMKALRRAGSLLWKLADYEAARRRFELALSIAEALGDERGQSGLLNNLGACAHNRGDYETARGRYEQAAAILRRLGDEGSMASLLNNLGLVASHQGDLDGARELYEQSLELHRQAGDQEHIANTVNNLGVVAVELGDGPVARKLFSEGLEIFRTLGNRRETAWSLCNLANVLGEQGELDSAADMLRESLAIRGDIGDLWGIAHSLEDIGMIELAEGRLHRACVLWGAADRIRRQIGSPLPPLELRRFERKTAAARAAFGDDANFDAWWAEGRSMSAADACALASAAADCGEPTELPRQSST